MQLEDLKQSITSLSPDEALLIHREIRKKRMMVGVTTKKKTTVEKRKKDTANKREIKQDPEKIRAFIAAVKSLEE